MNILQDSPINIEEKFPQKIKYLGRVCRFDVIYFVSHTDLGKSLPKPSGKSYLSFCKIFNPGYQVIAMIDISYSPTECQVVRI